MSTRFMYDNAVEILIQHLSPCFVYAHASNSGAPNNVSIETHFRYHKSRPGSSFARFSHNIPTSPIWPGQIFFAFETNRNCWGGFLDLSHFPCLASIFAGTQFCTNFGPNLCEKAMKSLMQAHSR